MEGLGDLSSDPDAAAPGFPVSLGLSEALEVAGLSEQGDAKPFEKALANGVASGTYTTVGSMSLHFRPWSQ